jgi:hypothetical protein
VLSFSLRSPLTEPPSVIDVAYWHFSDFAPCLPGVRNALKSGHRLNISTTLPANTPFQNLRAKRDSKLTYLTAWTASFVRMPCR